MTNATLKSLVDVYGTLLKAGWGEPGDQGAQPMAPDHEAAEQLPEAEQLEHGYEGAGNEARREVSHRG